MTGTRLQLTRAERGMRLLELAASQAGYFTAAQAREVDYSARSLHYRVAAGHVERVRRGLYRLVGLPAEPHEDIVAAWLAFATRRAVVSHETALALYDLAPSRSHEIHLTVPRQMRPRSPRPPDGVALHTTIVPLRHDEVAKRFGVEITSPARTLVDVADVGVDPSVVVEAVARALGAGLVTSGELREAVKRRSARVRRLVERAIQDAAANA